KSTPTISRCRRPSVPGLACAGRKPLAAPAPAELEAGLGLAARVQSAVDLLGAETRHLLRQLAHRTVLLGRALGDLRRLVVANQGIERRGHGRRALHVIAALRFVGLEPGDALVGEDA